MKQSVKLVLVLLCIIALVSVDGAENGGKKNSKVAKRGNTTPGRRPTSTIIVVLQTILGLLKFAGKAIGFILGAITPCKPNGPLDCEKLCPPCYMAARGVMSFVDSVGSVFRKIGAMLGNAGPGSKKLQEKIVKKVNEEKAKAKEEEKVHHQQQAPSPPPPPAQKEDHVDPPAASAAEEREAEKPVPESSATASTEAHTATR